MVGREEWFYSGCLCACPARFFSTCTGTAASSCNRPLHLWVLVHVLLCGVLQTPIRLLFCVRIMVVEHLNGDLEECVSRLCSGVAWRFSKFLSVLIYGWFVLGIVWVLN